MSRAGWVLRRLAAMSAAELGHRAFTAVRDRLAPPSYSGKSPAAAFGLLYAASPAEVLRTARFPRLLEGPAPTAGFEPELAAAEGLAAGRWEFFGHQVQLDDPPAWSRNPRSGVSWPELPSARLDYRRSGPPGGAKYVWELGRLTTLPTLALASRLTGRPEPAARAVRWLDDWTSRNPLGHGIHHTSGIEMAMRVLTGTWTLALLGARAEGPGLGPALGLLAQQALSCRDHLSLGSSGNNHLLSEYAAMATMGAAFPALRPATQLLEQGLAGLEREIPRQIHPDGVSAEQAFGYLPFIWELLLYPLLLAEVAGRPAGARTRERLRATLDFARVVRLPAGHWPQLGDEDDGRVLLTGEPRSRLDLVGNALAAWLGEPALGETDGALARLLALPARPAGAAPDGVRAFPEGGYTVWRDRGLLVTLDHGPLGLGRLAAHGHADALSVTVFRGRDPVVVDPGTLAYHEDLEARERCRSTPVHSTVNFGGRSQSESLGPFMWGRQARSGMEDGWAVCRWATGETHRRRVELEPGRVTLTDQVRGPGAELGFALAPGAEAEVSGRQARVRIGSTRATFDSQDTGDWRLEPAECAPRFGQRRPAQRLVAGIPGGGCRTGIRLEDA